MRSRYLEYLPLLSAFVIAGDDFTAKQPGFQLYYFDTKAKIFTTDVAGWFSRWMMAQDFQLAGSVVDWTVEPEPQSFVWDMAIAGVIGFVTQRGFLTLTVLMHDWWGFANALSMVFSTLTRAYLFHCNRMWLDAGTKTAWDNADQPAEGVRRATMIVILSDSKAVLVRAPACIVKACITSNPAPAPPKQNPGRLKRQPTWPVKARPEARKPTTDNSFARRKYNMVRWVAWISFGAHVITIGMSDLVSQLVTVVILVGSTFLILQKFGCGDDCRVGSRLRADISDFPGEDLATPGRRIDLYAALNFDKADEDTFQAWNLAPSKSNED